MPNEDEPNAETWRPAIADALAALDPGTRPVVVGHSVGATILLHVLAEEPPATTLGAIVVISAPFAGVGGWPGGGFELPSDLGTQLQRGVPVEIFHGLDDDEVPATHADLYARAIPAAHIHRLPGRDHQLNNDLREVAVVIAGAATRADDGPPRPSAEEAHG